MDQDRYREELRKEIEMLIDESNDQWRKAVFYSDETVQRILDRLYGEWEKNNRAGVPLDYASTEELETLAALARRYSRIDSGLAMRALIFSDRPSTQEEIEESGSSLKRILKRLFWISG